MQECWRRLKQRPSHCHTHSRSVASGTEWNSISRSHSTRRRGIRQVKGTYMRRVWFLVLAAVLFASCGIPQPPGVATPASPGGTPSAGQNQTVTISFAVWEYERSFYHPLVERFTSEHPDINVVLVSLVVVMMFNPGNNEPSSPLDQLRRVVSAADTAPSFAVTQEAFGTPCSST